MIQKSSSSKRFQGNAFLLITLIFFVSASIKNCEAQPPTVSGYQLNWFDNFNGVFLNQGLWSPQFNLNPTNNSLHAYLPENVSVADGNMVILSEDQPFGSFAYRSGQVISTMAHRFGRFEVRGKLPTTQGMWPAIWLLPDAPWPSQGEIDIMENRGNEPFLTSSAFHWGTNPPFFHDFVYNEFQISANDQQVNFHDSFHVYAAEWDPEQIRFYVDGVHHYTVRNTSVGNFLTNAQTSPMRLIINTAIGGNFLPNPNASTQWPQRFEVDYVYVYDRVGDPVLELENTDFEMNNGSISNWRVFGNSGSNVSANNSNAQSGSSSLKVFGQFSSNPNFSGIEQGISVQAGDLLRIKASSLVDSSDSIAGTGNRAVLKLDFYNELYGAFGSANYISSQEITLADGGTVQNTWVDREFLAIAPSGAVEARAAIVFVQNDNDVGGVFVDDIEFENMSESEDVLADSVNVVNGSQSLGNLSDLESSDGVYVRVAAAPANDNQTPIQISLEADTMFLEPSSITFQLEHSANTPNLEIEIMAFNFQTSDFELLDNGSVELQDNAVTASVTENADRFVNATGRMIFLLSYKATGSTLFFPWSANLDQVQWTVQR